MKFRERLDLLSKIFTALPRMIARFGAHTLFARARSELRTNGWRRCVLWAAELAAYEMRNEPKFYRRWILQHRRRAPVPSGVEVAIVMAVDRLDAQTLDAVASIVRQTHSSWRMTVLYSEHENVTRPSDPRVAFVELDEPYERKFARGIELSAGEFVLFMHPHCVLAADALAQLLFASRSADIVYCDEDELSGGTRHSPSFKPGYSIDLARACDYIGPVFLCRRTWLQSLQPRETDPYKLALRAGAAGVNARIVRVSEVLVHWTIRRDVSKRALPHDGNTVPLPGLVSIIIPTKDRIDLLSKCVDSIYEHPQRVSFEVIVMDNRSERPETRAWFASATTDHPDLRVVEADYPFNWSRLNNHGVSCAHGDVLLFLNNDTEVLSEQWLDRLVSQSRRREVATVGALLFYPDRTIQHAGIVVGIGGVADHVYSGCPDRGDDRHLFVSPYLPRNVLAVTGACLAIRRSVLDEIGGFDERLQICGDVELGVRAHRRGYLNVYDPSVQLYHHESATRPKAPLGERELDLLRPIIEDFVASGDPFYHPNLSLRSRYPTFSSGAEMPA